jgi:hypothetical protein
MLTVIFFLGYIILPLMFPHNKEFIRLVLDIGYLLIIIVYSINFTKDKTIYKYILGFTFLIVISFHIFIYFY